MLWAPTLASTRQGLLAPFPSHADWGVNFQTTYVKSSLLAGTHPYALVTGDFTGDGRIDLAVGNAGADPASGVTAQGYVSILAGGGESSRDFDE